MPILAKIAILDPDCKKFGEMDKLTLNRQLCSHSGSIIVEPKLNGSLSSWFKLEVFHRAIFSNQSREIIA